jgi:hypothetical protein
MMMNMKHRGSNRGRPTKPAPKSKGTGIPSVPSRKPPGTLMTPLPGQDEIRTAKKGGMIKSKSKKYGKGGRGDGCAVRGKTRGRMR